MLTLQAFLKPTRTRHDTWEKWLRWWHASFYAMLIGFSMYALVNDSAAVHLPLLVIAFSCGVWYLLSLPHDRQFWHTHPLFSAIYFLAGWSLSAGLIHIDNIFSYLLFGLFPQVCIKLPARFCLLAMPVLAAIWYWQEAQWGEGTLSGLLSILGTTVLSLILKMFIEAIILQNIERRELIDKLEKARIELAAVERQAGVLEERQRLAREIHDTLAQGFISIVLHLEAAEAVFPPSATSGWEPAWEVVDGYLHQARRTARESLGEARRLVWALQPEQLERASLPEALARIATRCTEESGLAACAVVTGQPHPLRPEVEVTLLRAAQEALANALKHAHARQVRLTLSYMTDVVMLDVQDDGIGFVPEEPSLCDNFSADLNTDSHSSGFGLKAMRTRVAQLGGTLLIESAPGDGTTLAVSLPAFSESCPEPRFEKARVQP